LRGVKSHFGTNPSSIKDNESHEPTSVKASTFSFSNYGLYLVALGCVLDVFSTFFPWSEIDGQHWFLPFSFPLPLGWQVHFMPERAPLLVVSVATRVAGFLGIAGIILLGRLKRGVFPWAVFISSAAMSFVSFGIFSQLDWSLYLGVYLVLFGGFLKVVGLVLENLEVQLVVEENAAAAGN
jgi:hypothetical protein